MSTSDQSQSQRREHDHRPPANESVDQDGHVRDVLDDVDELLDEIDEVLEENAEEFVRGYVQKGGQ